MTKDELEKEAEEFTDSKKSFWRQGRTCIASVKQAYIAGAEPREKQIEELERKLEQTEKDLADYQFNYPTIKELQKENAELKEKLEIEQNARGDWFGKAVTKDRRLNEAKEIIRELISMKSIYATCKEVEHRFTTIAKAEAFLKE